MRTASVFGLGVLLSLICFPGPAPGQSNSPGTSSPPALGKLVDVGGYRVHLYCTGEGTPAVVIVGAGFSFNWDSFNPKSQNSLKSVPMTIPALAGATMALKIHALLG